MWIKTELNSHRTRIVPLTQNVLFLLCHPGVYSTLPSTTLNPVMFILQTLIKVLLYPEKLSFLHYPLCIHELVYSPKQLNMLKKNYLFLQKSVTWEVKTLASWLKDFFKSIKRSHFCIALRTKLYETLLPIKYFQLFWASTG